MIRIGLTLGDPCGIGPELWLKVLLPLLAEPQTLERLTLYGDLGVLERAAAQLGQQAAWRSLREQLAVVEVTCLSAPDAQPGQPTPKSGISQVSYIEAAIADAAAGRIQGLCTGPIHKASAKEAGLAFPGHTELLAAHLLAPQREVVMMLAGPKLRVALCTIHIALAEVPRALSVSGICQTLITTALALHHDFAETSPQIHVLGLNPHAGESGHFGDEESRLILPAIERTRRSPELQAMPGVCLSGPLVPDVAFRHALFPPAGQSRPSAIVAMYHDQGLIPVKLLDFDETVNITLGLRVVRTSPDHGTAHDIAGAGVARPDSLHAALRLCLDHTSRRFGFSRQN